MSRRKPVNRQPVSGFVGRRIAGVGDLHGFRTDDDMRQPEAKPLPAGVEGHVVVTRKYGRAAAA